MRIVIAPDSFKESLSAAQVAQAIARGVLNVLPDADVRCVPMADGGEGSLDAILAATDGQRCQARVHDANGHHCLADWGLLDDHTAFIEMATAAGLERIPVPARDPRSATSFGVGELIIQALDAGARTIVLGLGGSATNDAGAGLFQALGGRLLDAGNRELAPGGAALIHLQGLDTSCLDARLGGVQFKIAVDVSNPLCGPHGASHIFGPQKGASPEIVQELDTALGHFADVIARHTGHDFRNMPGMGAAGGLALPVRSFMQAVFQPGVELIAGISGLDAHIQHADLVITGEGRMDAQTLSGKTPVGVARIARKHNVPVLALAGSLGTGYQALYAAGIDAAFSLAPGPVTLEHAMANAAMYLEHRTTDCIRLWLLGHRRGNM
ncbi:MAG: glycerate kinase [Alcaligenaceae bacterium]|nr:glycerate kinase [Alcaligenaceae bacterium]